MKEIQITKNFALTELCRTNTGLPNEPTPEVIPKLITLTEKVLQPVRDMLGFTIHVDSGYRSPAVNEHVGGKDDSQHLKGEAADLKSEDNAKMFYYIKDNLEFDQLIWEKGNAKQPAWVHVSYREGKNRKQVINIK